MACKEIINLHTLNMKTALHIDLTFDQVLDMVKQLPLQQKIRLSKELEKETIDSMLTRLQGQLTFWNVS